MKFECSRCFTRYDVPDEKVPESGIRVRCINCWLVWHQDKIVVKEPTKNQRVSEADAVPSMPIDEDITGHNTQELSDDQELVDATVEGKNGALPDTQDEQLTGSSDKDAVENSHEDHEQGSPKEFDVGGENGGGEKQNKSRIKFFAGVFACLFSLLVTFFLLFSMFLDLAPLGLIKTYKFLGLYAQNGVQLKDVSYDTGFSFGAVNLNLRFNVVNTLGVPRMFPDLYLNFYNASGKVFRSIKMAVGGMVLAPYEVYCAEYSALTLTSLTGGVYEFTISMYDKDLG